MDNNIENTKEHITLKYSFVLAFVWLIATYWLRFELLLDIIFNGWVMILAGIFLLICLPAYLISIFVKRYNSLYVQCKMNIRKESVRKGIIAGISLYGVCMLIFIGFLGIYCEGICSTLGLATGCFVAYSHLKKFSAAEEKNDLS